MNKIVFSGLLVLVCCLIGDVEAVQGKTDVGGQCIPMEMPKFQNVTLDSVCHKAGYGRCLEASGQFITFSNNDCTGFKGGPMIVDCNTVRNIPFDYYSTKIIGGKLVCDVKGWGILPAPKNVPKDLRQAVANATNWLLGFISLIATLVVIWGGINYLTAAGDEDRVKTAKRIIKYGLMGVVIAGFAYAIVTVIAMILN